MISEKTDINSNIMKKYKYNDFSPDQLKDLSIFFENKYNECNSYMREKHDLEKYNNNSKLCDFLKIESQKYDKEYIIRKSFLNNFYTFSHSVRPFSVRK